MGVMHTPSGKLTEEHLPEYLRSAPAPHPAIVALMDSIAEERKYADPVVDPIREAAERLGREVARRRTDDALGRVANESQAPDPCTQPQTMPRDYAGNPQVDACPQSLQESRKPVNPPRPDVPFEEPDDPTVYGGLAFWLVSAYAVIATLLLTKLLTGE